jgi:hypothetical protein
MGRGLALELYPQLPPVGWSSISMLEVLIAFWEQFFIHYWASIISFVVTYAYLYVKKCMLTYMCS